MLTACCFYFVPLTHPYLLSRCGSRFLLPTATVMQRNVRLVLLKGRTHTWPSCLVPRSSMIVPAPLSPTGLRSHCSSLTWPEHAYVFTGLPNKRSTTRTMKYWTSFFFHLVTTMFGCSLVSMIETKVADFSTALYPDFVCCPLPKFEANTPLTVAAMSSCRRPVTRAIVLCQSTPLPTMPGPRKRIVLEHGMQRSH